MVTRGEILTIDYTGNTCTVRMPYFESAGVDDNVVATATFTNTPGSFNGYKVGDIVTVAFNDGESDEPVIIGKQFNSLSAEQADPRGVINCENLTVSNDASIPLSTRLTQEQADDVAQVGLTGFNTIADIANSITTITKKQDTDFHDLTNIIATAEKLSSELKKQIKVIDSKRTIYEQASDPSKEKLEFPGYVNFTTTDEYVGYYLSKDSTEAVTTETKDKLGIVPGTTIAYTEATNVLKTGDLWIYTGSTICLHWNEEKSQWEKVEGSIPEKLEDYVGKYIKTTETAAYPFAANTFVLVTTDNETELIKQSQIIQGKTLAYINFEKIRYKDTMYAWTGTDWQETTSEELTKTVEFSSKLEQTAEHIEAKVSKTDENGITSGFGWNLDNETWVVYSAAGGGDVKPGSEEETRKAILVVNKDGLTLKGTIKIGDYIKYTETKYDGSTSKTTAPTETDWDKWYDTEGKVPAEHGTYIWKWERQIDGLGKVFKEYKTCITGEKGDDGAATYNYYIASASSSNPGYSGDEWTRVVKSPTAARSYVYIGVHTTSGTAPGSIPDSEENRTKYFGTNWKLFQSLEGMVSILEDGDTGISIISKDTSTEPPTYHLIADSLNGSISDNVDIGGWTVGPDSLHSGSSTGYISLHSDSRRTITSGSDKYERQEYIQSSGTQYINTNFLIESGMSIKITFALVDTTAAERDIYGFEGTPNLILGTVSGTKTWLRVHEYNAEQAQYMVEADTAKHTVTFGKEIIVDDVVQKTGLSGPNAIIPGFLFASNQDGTATYFVNAKLYRCTIFASNGTKLRDFIPVLKNEDEYGLYDLIEGKWYANDGSGAFTGNPYDSEFYSIYLGNDTSGAAPFRVTNTGKLYAESGHIGGFDISDDSFVSEIIAITPESIYCPAQGSINLKNNLYLKTVSKDDNKVTNRDAAVIESLGFEDLIFTNTLGASGTSGAGLILEKTQTEQKNELALVMHMKTQVEEWKEYPVGILYKLYYTPYCTFHRYKEDGTIDYDDTSSYYQAGTITLGFDFVYKFYYAGVPGKEYTVSSEHKEFEVKSGSHTYEFGYTYTGYVGPTQLTPVPTYTISPLESKLINIDTKNNVMYSIGSIFPWAQNGFSAGMLGDETHPWLSLATNNFIIVTSDRNKKNSIEKLTDNYSILFDNLLPVKFKLNNGTSGRLHTGLIAQDVEEAVLKSGLTLQEFGGIIKGTADTGDIEYSLRYEEFIAILIDQVQKLKKQNVELNTKVSTLENKLNLLLEKYPIDEEDK